jgi:hypothetical protein
MREWWWWLPGWRKKWKIEKRRIEALSDITGERLHVELMAQRPRRPKPEGLPLLDETTETHYAFGSQRTERIVPTDY